MRWLVPMILLLAACREEAGAPDDACGADAYAGLIGSNIAAVTLPADLNHRVLGPNDAATMDFVPDRLNIETDADGVIIGLRCG